MQQYRIFKKGAYKAGSEDAGEDIPEAMVKWVVMTRKMLFKRACITRILRTWEKTLQQRTITAVARSREKEKIFKCRLRIDKADYEVAFGPLKKKPKT